MARAGPFVLAAVLFWIQAQMALQMLYTDQMRLEEGKRVAAGIEGAFDAVTGGDSKLVIFIGEIYDELNLSCLRGDYAGVSILGWDC